MGLSSWPIARRSVRRFSDLPVPEDSDALGTPFGTLGAKLQQPAALGISLGPS